MSIETNAEPAPARPAPEAPAWDAEPTETADEPAERAWSADRFEARLRVLVERDAARDRELTRLRQDLDELRRENAGLRREATDARLERAVQKQRLQDHIAYTRRADDELWGLVYAFLTAVCLVSGLVVIFGCL
jgi:hypothetical protein